MITRENTPIILVLGIGNPQCGDDAAGPEVVSHIKKLNAEHIIAKAVRGEPSTIISSMKGHSYVILVDAILAHSATGTLHVFDASRGALPAELFGHFSTHSFGLADAIELARALGELPPKLIVLGIEGNHFEPGDPMSPAVKEAIIEATRWIYERADTYTVPYHT